MTQPQSSHRLFARDRLALWFGLLTFTLHIAFSGQYDVFRDELYFIVCGQHPDFGYVDQPPLIPILAAALWKMGHTVWLLRLPGALSQAVLVWLSVRFVRLIGGARLSAVIAAAAVMLSPLLMGASTVLHPGVFDPLIWTAIVYGIVRAIRQDKPDLLMVCGLLAGIDLEAKYSLLFWLFSLVIGLLAIEQRQILIKRGVLIGVALCALIAVPSVLWQASHGFPFLELGAAAKGKNADSDLLSFILNQFLITNPILSLVWLTGLASPFVDRRLKALRFVSIAYVIMFILVILTHGKDYYLTGCYPALFVLGAVWIGSWADTTRTVRYVSLGGLAVATAISLILAPLAVPVLSPEHLVAYMNWLPVKPQQQEKTFKGTAMPQLFADQLGWRDFTHQVLEAWLRIPKDDRIHTGIKVDNYGEAAALDVYGEALGLPPAFSGHNQYYLWSLRGQHPDNLLVVQDHPERLKPYCESMDILGTTHSRFAMHYENGKVIALCKGVHPRIETMWSTLKTYQ